MTFLLGVFIVRVLYGSKISSFILPSVCYSTSIILESSSVLIFLDMGFFLFSLFLAAVLLLLLSNFLFLLINASPTVIPFPVLPASLLYLQFAASFPS